MEKVFCKDKKDFCECIESCQKCKFAKGNGVIIGYIAHDVLATLFGNYYDMDRLKEIVEADRDGRCVVLPCKVGDTVYLNDIVEYEIDDAGNNQYLTVSGTVTNITICDDKKIKIKCKESGNYIWILEETVFLTREKAEAALRRMQDEGVH